MSSKTPVKTTPDRPLTKSELTEVVRLRAETEFQDAKVSYEQERHQLLLELKGTESPEDKSSIITRLDECEHRFSRVYGEFRSGRRKYLIEEDERRKNRERRDRSDRLKNEGSRHPGAPVKKARGQKPTATAGPAIHPASDAEVRVLERQGFKVVRLYGNRADCVECGKRVELTPDRKWHRHGWAGRICRPDYTNIVFVKVGAGKARSKPKQKAKPKPKKTKAKTNVETSKAPVRLVGIGKKPLTAAEKRKAQKKQEEIESALRDMTSGRTRASDRWGVIRGRPAPFAITRVVSGGAVGSNRRRN